MLVSISIGSKSRAVINTLKVSADNFDFATFSSMNELIKTSTLRHISFDRIVFSSEILNSKNPEGDLESLHEFIVNNSSQTELVFIIKGSSELEHNLDKVFSSMFNSPMYTPVIMKKASAQTLLEIVRDDITELKTRYYVLQDKEDLIITSASTNQESKESSVEQPKQEKRKGLFERVFGSNAKKEALLNEIAQQQKKGSQNVGNSGENVTNELSDNTQESTCESTGDISKNDTFKDSVKNNNQNIFDKSINGSVSEGVNNLNSEFSTSMNEDEMLSIGEFGEKHSDTGFLDNNEEEELRQYVESKNSGIEEVGISEESVDEEFYGFTPNFNDVVDEPIKDEPEKEQVEEPKILKENIEIIPENPDRHSNIDIIISVKGSGATQNIVDTAVKMVEEDKLRVLIIDLDLKENGLLSYIDTERFYMQGSNEGISKLRVYEEDGVDVVSNGYGVPVNRRVLANFLSSRIIKKYDMVFIDCPTESLSLFNYDMISKCNILVMSGNDRSDLLATTLAITDRRNVEYKVEKYIAETCMVEITGGKYKVEDVVWLNSLCLFANGNWLSRIDL